jgi:hypothetical protein
LNFYECKYLRYPLHGTEKLRKRHMDRHVSTGHASRERERERERERGTWTWTDM